MALNPFTDKVTIIDSSSISYFIWVGIAGFAAGVIITIVVWMWIDTRRKHKEIMAKIRNEPSPARDNAAAALAALERSTRTPPTKA